MSRARNEMRLNAPRYLMPPRLFKDAISEVNGKPRRAGGESHNSSWRCAVWCVVNYQRRKQAHGADTQAEVSFEEEVIGISHAQRNSIKKLQYEES